MATKPVDGSNSVRPRGSRLDGSSLALRVSAAAALAFASCGATNSKPADPAPAAPTKPAASARAQAKAGILELARAVDAYTIQHGGMAPKSLADLLAVDVAGHSSLPGAKAIPLDPWGHPYGYEPPTNERDYRVYTLGRDGKPGGNGEDMDVDNFVIRTR